MKDSSKKKEPRDGLPNPRKYYSALQSKSHHMNIRVETSRISSNGYRDATRHNPVNILY